MSKATEPGRCRECGVRGRYERYGSWYCERHVGLAERNRDRDEPIVPGPATPAERGAAAMETTPEQWRQGADDLARELAEQKLAEQEIAEQEEDQ